MDYVQVHVYIYETSYYTPLLNLVYVMIAFYKSLTCIYAGGH